MVSKTKKFGGRGRQMKEKSRDAKLLAMLSFAAAGAAMGLLSQARQAAAASVTLTASDLSGNSSFNSIGNWSNGAAPASTNTYDTAGFVLRTPTSGTSTFAGASLSIDSGGRFLGKSSGTMTISVGTLILNGGTFDQANSAGDSGVSLTVGGNITANTVTGGSFLGAVGAAANNSADFETLNITAAIGGSGSLTVAGGTNSGGDTGVVELSASNSYSGTITVVTPTNGFVASATNGLLQLNNLNALQNATLNLTSVANGVSFLSTANTGTFNIGALSGSSNQALTDTAGSATTLNVGSNNASTTYSGTLSGGGSLIKSGSGTFVLSGASSYTGMTTISAGTLSLSLASSPNNISSSSNVQLAGGATLNVNGLSGSSLALGAQTLTGPTSGTGTITGSLGLGATTIVTPTLGATLSISGSLTTTSGATYKPTGTPASGTTVYDLSSYTGTALAMSSPSTTVFPAISNIALNTTLLSSSYTYHLITGGGVGNSFTGSSVDLLVSPTANGVEYLLGTGDGFGGSSFTGGGSGAGWGNGGGSTVETTAATSTVNYFVGGGSTAAAIQLRTPTTSGPFTFTGNSLTLGFGGELLLKGSGNYTTTVNNLILDGGYINQGGVGSANPTVAGNITLAGTSTLYNNAATGGMTVAAPISGPGGLIVLTNAQTFNLTPTSSNTYSGPTFVGANEADGNSILQAGGSGAFSPNSAVVIAAPSSSTSQLELNGFSQSIGSLSSANNAGTAQVTNNSNTAATLTVGNDNTSTTFAGAISDTTGSNTGALSLTKVGAGTLTLSNPNSYTGGTTINAGTLRVNNSSGSSGTGTGTVTVQSGGTLGGNGYIGTSSTSNGTITVNSGGLIAAGASTSATGLLTSYSTSGVALSAGSGYTWKINADTSTGTAGGATGWDEIATQSILLGSGTSLSSSGKFTVNITGSPSSGFGYGTQLFPIATAVNGISLNGTAVTSGTNLSTIDSSDFVLSTSGFTAPSSASGLTTSWQLEVVAATGLGPSGQDLDLVYSATPEPGAMMLVLGGVVPMLIGRRRRRRAEAREANQ